MQGAERGTHSSGLLPSLRLRVTPPLLLGADYVLGVGLKSPGVRVRPPPRPNRPKIKAGHADYKVVEVGGG